ncbi:hypothetical protein [Zoogloea sp.]|uniref:hypothetical protein n=1 Tax=Zoogloea sp. TaxID=49181 RepID=UPI00141696E8|nr:MAG: hypothetical protein F9K15_22045 [Zoogloea sp.]
MIKSLKLIFSLCAMLPLLALAQVVQVKGVGTVSYPGELSPTVKEKAYEKAQVAAVERYFAENGEAETQNFEAIQERIEASLEKFILSATILNEQDQPSIRKYSVTVRIELNVAKLRNTLRNSSAAGQANSTTKSQLVYIFVGREIDNVRAFDERAFKRIEAIDKGKAGNTSIQVETGGSTVRKADEIKYRLMPMANYATSITNIFSQGGFNVADPTFAIGDKDVKAVNKDFSAGNDLAQPTLRSVVDSLKKQQVPYLVLATLDLGAPSQDPASGMQRVGVTVTARVLDLTGRLPREVASVPAVQYFGLGPDNQAAGTKAMKEGSLSAAREVVARLNAANVH